MLLFSPASALAIVVLTQLGHLHLSSSRANVAKTRKGKKDSILIKNFKTFSRTSSREQQKALRKAEKEKNNKQRNPEPKS
ncbi:hypothetical protein M758_4G034300 [Ceratodon purpureus]|nr:hypothetical protein M758_4G034300 [Ceratodon purpureus]